MTVLESAAAYELLNTAFQDSVLQLGTFQRQCRTDCPTAVKESYSSHMRCVGGVRHEDQRQERGRDHIGHGLARPVA
jgi:hypothetical protein